MVKLKRTPSIYDEDWRDDENDNWRTLEGETDRLSGIGRHAEKVLADTERTLNEAQKTNNMNKDVQAQVDNLILHSGASDAEVIQARGGLPLLKDRLDKTDSRLAQTHTKAEVDNLVGQMESGVKGTFLTLSDLENEYPNGNTGNYVIQSDGHVYTWKESEWKNTGIQYQSTGIAPKSINTKELNTKAVSVGDIADELIFEFNGKKFSSDVPYSRSAMNIWQRFNLSELGIDFSTGKAIEFGLEGYAEDDNIIDLEVELWLNSSNSSLGGATVFNGFNKLETPEGKYFRYYDGAEVSSEHTWLHFLVFFGVKNKNVISTIYAKNFYINIEGVRYYPTQDARFVGSPSEQEITDVTNLPQRLVDFKYAETSYAKKSDVDIKSNWNGKNLVMLGDSITWQDGRVYGSGVQAGQIARGYGTILKERLGFSEILNKGVSGASIAENPNAYTDIYLTAKTIDYSGYDLVTIAGGTNDLKNNIPIDDIGSIADTTFDINTFYGAYRDIIEYILTQKPTIKICLFTPLQRDSQGFDIETTNTNGHKIIDYVNAIRLLGEMYSLPVCDLYSNGGLNSLTLGTYTIDKLHPHDLGYKRVSEHMISVLETV